MRPDIRLAGATCLPARSSRTIRIRPLVLLSRSDALLFTIITILHVDASSGAAITHFFSASVRPILAATVFNVSFSTLFVTLGNLCRVSPEPSLQSITTYDFFSRPSSAILLTVWPATSCLKRSSSSPERILPGVLGVFGVAGLGLTDGGTLAGAARPLGARTLCSGGLIKDPSSVASCLTTGASSSQ